MPRAQRFPDSFHQALQSLVLSIMPHITIRHMEIPEEARCVNLSLANFVKVGIRDGSKQLFHVFFMILTLQLEVSADTDINSIPSFFLC